MSEIRLYPELKLGGTAVLAGGMAGVWLYLFGGWSAALEALTAMIVIDYLTGLAAAFVEGDLSSRTGFTGLLRKGAMLTLVIVVNLTGRVVGGEAFGALNVSLFASVLAVNESLSVLENLRRLGVPVPGFLVERLRGARDALVGEKGE